VGRLRAGNFDFTLTFTPPLDPSGPSVFVAIQEQLGLKLEATRGQVDVLVIDRICRPTPD
jgi:uncharacterized protein (TIGR03435 family)